MSFRLNPKWVFSVHPHFTSNSPLKVAPFPPPCSSVKLMDASLSSISLSFPSTISEEDGILLKEPLKAYASATSCTVENDYAEVEELKINFGAGLYRNPSDIIDAQRSVGQAGATQTRQSCSLLQFSLLMKNLYALEETFDSLDSLRLEKDIMLHLGRLGALELFNNCLSKSVLFSNVVDSSDTEEHVNRGLASGQTREVVVSSRRKKARKSRRERALENCNKSSMLSCASRTSQNGFRNPTACTVKKASNFKQRRMMVARNEAEMSRGVKIVANLERIRATLEEGTGKVASLSCWADASGMNEKVLLQNLHFGWQCRDELLKSTRSLVLFLARNYRRLGISHKDLIQAGNLGVLQGAERFDHTRGYKFSTYVQFWIRKSMSMMVARHSKGIHIPCSVSRAMNQIQKAQKMLSTSHGMKYPADDEIAKLTGLSLNKIISASLCLRVVGSIDQKMGDSINAKFLELTPDMAIETPEEAVMRQSMKRDVWNLLEGLDLREKQVMVLRYGLKDHQPKSLQEIGEIFRVSKEWIRKIEKKAMTKLREDSGTFENTSVYLDS